MGGIWAALISDTVFRDPIEEEVKSLVRGNTLLKGGDILKRFIYATVSILSAFGVILAMYLYVFVRNPASLLYYANASKLGFLSPT